MESKRKPLKLSLALIATLVVCGHMYGHLPVITEAFDSIPFEIGNDGKIYINAIVNSDTIPLRFLFDTGAVDNVLNINSIQALKTINPEYLEKGISNTATSTITVTVTPYENSITIGETQFQGVRFVLAPCADSIDGIIGWNTLTGADFLIDYHQQLIKFYDNGECLIQDVTQWIPLTFIDGLPSINLDFEYEGESYQVNVWLDSGSDRCFDLSTQYIVDHQLRGKKIPWGFSQIAGMEGFGASIEESFADKIKIGDYFLYQVPTGLNLSNSGIASNKNFGGVMGNNLLQRFNQIWSFSGRRLYLQPNRRMYSTPYKPLEDLLKNGVLLDNSDSEK